MDTARDVMTAIEKANVEIEEKIKDGAELVIITSMSQKDWGEIKSLASLTEQEFRSEYVGNWEDHIPLKDRFDIPEGYRNIGFTFVGNDTWLPNPLYEDRERQRRRVRQGSERGIVWTR